jgi:hypothetical protein
MIRPAVVDPPKGTPITLAADYPPAVGRTTYRTNGQLRTNWVIFTNLTAFIEVRTNLMQLNWIRVGEASYPTNGGTFRVPYTNYSPTLFFRAGYSVH